MTSIVWLTGPGWPAEAVADACAYASSGPHGTAAGVVTDGGAVAVGPVPPPGGLAVPPGGLVAVAGPDGLTAAAGDAIARLDGSGEGRRVTRTSRVGSDCAPFPSGGPYP
ncbi:hypothetical protein AB0E65_27920, partial [Streptomyces fragilis]